eukprot:2278925-Pyramimonas_sp.AAC.1
MPSSEEWMGVLGAAGCEGGLAAHQAVWQEMVGMRQIWRHSPPTAESRPERLQEAWFQATIDMEQLQHYTRRAGKRRSVPPWSLPLELWYLVLHTPAAPESNVSRVGLGADTAITDAVEARQWMHKLFTMIRFWGTVPSIWNCSRGFVIPKSALPGPRGKRIVHGLDPISKGFFEGLMRLGPKYVDSDCDHGFLRSRRREDAIVANMCTSWRLSAAGFSWCDSLKDLTNAFASSHWAKLDQACHNLVRPRDIRLCRQRHRCSG